MFKSSTFSKATDADTLSLLSNDYKVFVNGIEVSVYNCRISAYPFNRHWPYHQRQLEQSEKVSYVNIVSDEDIDIKIIPAKKDYSRIMLKPYSKNVVTIREGDTISFSLKEHGGYVLELDDYHGCLYIFNNKPIPAPDPNEVTYYFGEGIHHVGKLTLKSNESVYVDTNALVFGNIYAENAQDLHIFGNGIFNDGGEERCLEHCYQNHTVGNLKMYDCKNIKIEGVGFTNSAIWCINLFHCFDVEIDGIRVFGEWRYNTDGIDAGNSQRVVIKNSFVHSFDDTIVIKGIDRYVHTICSDILVENCVLWCDWGRSCELGYETACREYKNIIFRNCDVLRGASAVCSVHNGDCAEIHDVIYEDIRVELESFYTKPLLQLSDDHTYTETDVAETRIIDVNNNRFRDSYAFLNLPDLQGELKKGDKRFASAHDIIFRNISVYCDDKLFSMKGEKCALIKINNVIPTTEFYNLKVENISLNGKKLNSDDIDLFVNGTVKDINILEK